MMNDSLNNHLGEMMGWHKDDSPNNTRVFWVDDFGAIQAVADKAHGLHDTWNPPENLLQAFQCLDAKAEYQDWAIRNDIHREQKGIVIWKTNREDGSTETVAEVWGDQHRLANTISTAIAKATGWKK